MQFDYDDYGPCFTGLCQPYVSPPLGHPGTPPTSLFGGSIPAVQFGAVTAVHFGTVTSLHAPEFQPVYVAGHFTPHTQFATLHAIVGHSIDVRG